MSRTGDAMELGEEAIRAQYGAALAMLEGLDHAPRVAAAREAQAERSAGVGTRRAFRSTTPGLAARRTARPETACTCGSGSRRWARTG